MNYARSDSEFSELRAEKDESFITNAVKVVAMAIRPSTAQKTTDMSQVLHLTISYSLCSGLFEKLKILCGPEIGSFLNNVLAQDDSQVDQVYLISDFSLLVLQKTKEFLFFIEIVRLLSNIVHFVRMMAETNEPSVSEVNIELANVLSSTNFVGSYYVVLWHRNVDFRKLIWVCAVFFVLMVSR
jgi:hypothetical protein